MGVVSLPIAVCVRVCLGFDATDGIKVVPCVAPGKSDVCGGEEKGRARKESERGTV
jgi:hypothetical protein